jgi:hypothetical protein
MQLPRLQDDSFVQGLMMPAITFTDKDPQQHSVLWKVHNKADEWMMD